MRNRQNKRTAGEKFQTKSALQEYVRQMLMIERLCSRFHHVVRQLQSRYLNRPTLYVEDEHDVRDLLHVLLTLDHEDIRPLVWVPAYTDGRSQTDFLLRLEQIVIQAKKTREGFGAKELEEQLWIDFQRYRLHPDCKTLVCFVYDPDGRIPNPRTIENDLSGDKDGLTIRILIAPQGLYSG